MSDYQVAVAAMESMAENGLSRLEFFHRKTYVDSFNSFYEAHIPAFDAIEQLYGQVREPDEMIMNMALAYVEGAKKILDGVSKKVKVDAKMMELNMQLAVFTYPAILHYKGSSSAPLAECISKEWKKQFPKSDHSWMYRMRTNERGKASDCIKCGACERICPQHLPVRSLLEEVAKEFE